MEGENNIISTSPCLFDKLEPVKPTILDTGAEVNFIPYKFLEMVLGHEEAHDATVNGKRIPERRRPRQDIANSYQFRL